MRKILLIAFILLKHNAIANYCWVQKANVGSFNRYASMGFSLNGKGYVGCGYTGSVGTNDFWEYDTLTNIWTQKANYNGGLIWAGHGFSIGSKGYFTLGTSGSFFPTSLNEYDPIANTWTPKAAFPTTGRQDFYAYSINNDGYVVGGWRSGNYYNTQYKYSQATNSWVQVASRPGTARDGIRGFVLNGKAYVGTGQNSGTIFNDMSCYNPTTDSWTAIPNVPGLPRNSAVGFTFSGKGFFGLGNNNFSSSYTDIYEYNDILNTWTLLPISFPGLGTSYSIGFSFAARGYITTGRWGGQGQLTNQTYMLIESPSPLFTINYTGCGSNISLTNQTIGATSYFWNFGDGTTSTLQNPSHNYLSNGTYNVSLIVSNGQCPDTLIQSVTIANIVSSQFTLANFNCSNTISINNQSLNALNYNWNWGNGQTASGVQTSYTYPSPGSYTITLIASNGFCADTSTQSITISNPTISNFNFTTDCSNTINVTNQSINATNYVWNWGNGQSTSGNITNYTYPLPGTYNVSLIASNGSCSDTLTQQVIIAAGIVSTVNLTPGCNLNLDISNFTTTATSILWDWGNGNQTSGPVSSYIYSAPGNYVVTLILATSTCNDTIVTNVTIAPLVTSSFIATASCNQEVLLTNNSNNATNYTWDFGNGQQSSSNLTSYIYSQPGTYSISLIAQNSGCSDTTQQIITISPSTLATFTATADCNQGITISNQSQNATNYTWIWGDGNISSNNPNYYQYLNTGNFTISMIAFNGVCSDTTILNIQVDTMPVAQINYNMNTCRDSVQFESMNLSTSVAWNLGNGSTSTNSITTGYYNSSGNYTITLINTNLFCADTTSTSITLPGDPNASTNYTLGCDGVLSVNPIQDPSWTYQWNFGDGNSASGVNPTHTYSTSGQYVLTLVVDNGFCLDSSSQTLLYSTPNTYSILSSLDSCALRAAFSLSPTPTDSVIWNFGDGTTSNMISPMHQYGISTNYLVQVIINPFTVCSDTVEYQIDFSSISSLENLFLPNSFTEWDQVNDLYRLENNTCENISISIYNRWGALVHKSDDITNPWNGKHNGQDLPQGVYKIIAKNKTSSKTGFITLIR
ncbi:MAG: PKD domain-containing protein [Bacteroidetes bacterium]|nr:PKD domain-containing protein [Bacteroidota bacterium]